MTIERGARESESPMAAPGITRQSLIDNPRLLSLAFGSGLLLGTTSRRSLPLALTGALLLYHGATGRWAFTGVLDKLGHLPRRQRRTSVPHQSGIKIERSVLVRTPPEVLYHYWRDLENLPRFMSQHASVQHISSLRSHWKIKSVAGATIEWDAEIVNDVPNELIAWRSLEGGDLDHAGSVHFESDGAGGTRVTVVMEYRPPAGRLGAEIARILGQEPSQVLEKDLQRLKELCESGQLQTPAESPSGI